ncbi:MAG: hypothetical protein NT075_05590 [Chloroflexi bacterium]|nr:hypothetical protein [Chloroflexota bacterium]
MSTRLDLAAYNRNDQLTLVVEVKKKQDASPTWVAQLRRNLLIYDTFPNTPFFLLALPDRFYLWKNNNGKQSEASVPDYVIDAEPVFKPYLEQTGINIDQISSQSLELILTSWLNDLIHKRPDELDNSEHWLIDSGLYDALAGGRLAYEIMA